MSTLQFVLHSLVPDLYVQSIGHGMTVIEELAEAHTDLDWVRLKVTASATE